ncbi:hypothetical protein GCM10009839_47010 [Catenulispora yoronensis]|uniref:PLL-like beta propeller domain-containing protein n=1 Tax=Catenulispora yoronensis TaxID=450799 RepID=A0ABN2UMW0_9ACTN
MTISRRQVLSTAGAGVAALALDVVRTGAADAATAPVVGAAVTGARVAPADAASLISPTSVYLGTTSWDFTVQRRSYAGSGYQTLTAGDGEPHVVRTDLWSHWGHVTKPLVAFAQMTDLHIVDDQSTARLEFLDKFADPPHLNYPTDSSYRPHEWLSTQVVDAMCLAIRSLGKAPRTKLPLKFTIVTGDAIDNCQHNENRWYIDLLDGGQTILPDSGQAGLDESFAGGNLGQDPHFYYPAIQGSSTPDNEFTGTGTASAGFPYVPGVLSSTSVGAARRPYVSQGLGMPWYAAYGNHDGLWQGNLPIDSGAFDPRPFAVGPTKISNTDHSMPNDYNDLGKLGEWEASQGLFGVVVTSDSTRRLMTRTSFIEDHFTTHGTPVGHGFMSPDVNKAYYAIPFSDNDLVRFITLDSTNTNTDGFGVGSASGSIDGDQMSWLEDQLRANSRRYIDGENNVVTVPAGSPVQDKMFVLFCHHTLATMDNLDDGILGGIDGDRHSGDELMALIHRYPNVIAMVNGHTHANKITPHQRPQGAPIAGGFWEISTASHIDWPIQSRILEIAASKEGIGGEFGNAPQPATISIFTTMIDPAAPLVYNGDLSNTSQLASLARELATNDPQEVRGGITRRMGVNADRNTQLLLPAPFPINAPHEVGPPIAAARNADGRLELFGTDANGLLFNTAESAVGAATLPWQQLDQQPWRSVAAGAGTSDGKVELFTLDAGGVIWHRVQSSPGGDVYSAAAALDGTNFTAAATVNSGSGLMLFATTTAGLIYNRWENTDSGGGWGPWHLFAGAATQLAAEQNSKGFPVVVGVDENGLLFRRTGTRATAQLDADFNPPVGLDGNLDSVALTRTADGRLALFGSNSDGQLWQRYEVSPGSDNWGPWAAVPAQIGIAPLRVRHVAAQRNGAGIIELFIIDDAGTTFRSAQPSTGSFAWTPWIGVGFSAQPAADFFLSLSLPSGSVGAGTSTTTQVSVFPKNGFNQPVTLSVAGLPPGVTGTFLPSNTTSPTTPSPVLRITSSTDTPGLYALTIWAVSASGEAARANPYLLSVGQFKLWVGLQSDTVHQGGSTSTPIRVSGLGSTDPVTLNVKGLSAGITATFDPPTATATAPSTLTLRVSSTAAPGIHNLTVNAAAQNFQGAGSLPYQLFVVAGPPSM